MEEYEDIEITCGCGTVFVWSKGEQRFLQSLVDEGRRNSDGTPVTFTKPKRCKECRLKRRIERQRRGGI